MAKFEVLDKRKKCFMWFPIAFTTYEIRKKEDSEIELYVKMGLINVKEEKIKLYRINDISFNRSFNNFIYGVGNLMINSSDKSSNGVFIIKKIHKAKAFQEILEDYASKERERVGVVYKEAEVL